MPVALTLFPEPLSRFPVSVIIVCALFVATGLVYTLLLTRKIRLAPGVALVIAGVAVLFLFGGSLDHWQSVSDRETLGRAVAAQKEIFSEYGAYSPSVLDLVTIDPSLSGASEADTDPLLITAAPVTERIKISYAGQSVTLEGPVFAGESGAPSDQELTELASS